MAGTRAAVYRLLDDVWPRALAAVQREREELQQIPGAADQPIEAWDWRYWAEKVRQQRYALDDAQIKPYFPLPRQERPADSSARGPVVLQRATGRAPWRERAVGYA